MGYPSMERAGSLGDPRVPPTATDRPQREVEGIIVGTRQMAEQAAYLASKLHDVRRRLTGEGDPQQANTPAVKEAITSELVDLRQTLARLQDSLHDIGRYTESLERV